MKIFKKNITLENQEISFQSGVLAESSAMLGSSFRGAYGRLDDSLTYFSGINTTFNFSNFRLMGSYFYGMTKPDLGQEGIIKDISALTSSSFNLTLYKEGFFNKQDSFGFSLSQPLRLESGEIDFLSNIIKPELAVITNISYAHAKNFKNLDQIANAKSEIIKNINKKGSIVLNADDSFFNKHKKLALNNKLKIYSFSLNKRNASVYI